MGHFKRTWSKYVGLVLIFLVSYSFISWFYNEDYQLFLYPTKTNFKAWDFKFTFMVGKKKKKNIKFYEEEEKILKPLTRLDIDSNRK